MAPSEEQNGEHYREDGRRVSTSESSDPSRSSFKWLKREARGEVPSSKQKYLSRSSSTLARPETDKAAFVIDTQALPTQATPSLPTGRPARSISDRMDTPHPAISEANSVSSRSRPRRHGVITARGAAEHSLSSLIASMQRYTSNRSTFGLKLVSISTPCGATELMVEQGPVFERGSFNYRWPFHEYTLMQPNLGFEVGTCALFSFVRKGTLYQVMRLERCCRPEADDCAYINGFPGGFPNSA